MADNLSRVDMLVPSLLASKPLLATEKYCEDSNSRITENIEPRTRFESDSPHRTRKGRNPDGPCACDATNALS